MRTRRITWWLTSSSSEGVTVNFKVSEGLDFPACGIPLAPSSTLPMSSYTQSSECECGKVYVKSHSLCANHWNCLFSLAWKMLKTNQYKSHSRILMQSNPRWDPKICCSVSILLSSFLMQNYIKMITTNPQCHTNLLGLHTWLILHYCIHPRHWGSQLQAGQF